MNTTKSTWSWRAGFAAAVVGIPIVLGLAFGDAVNPLFASPASAAEGSAHVTGPIVGPEVTPKRSKPVRELALASQPTGEEVNPLQDDREVPPLILPALTGIADPVAQFSFSEDASLSLGLLGNPIVNVLGQGGANPNDTNGDVGPNHFVQAINSIVTVYNKQGTAAAGYPKSLGSFWQNNDGVADPCEGNAGDPVVLYDNMADRWLISQFAQTNFICIAISQTADPTGTYYQYVFGVARFPDYFKIGAWPDGYYVSANLNGPNEALAVVFDRANMLNGNPAGSVEFAAPTLTNNLDALMPSDVDGSTNPPFGTPNFMYRPHDVGVAPGGVDGLDIWEFHVDWTTPALSTFTALPRVPTAAFDSTTCGYVFPPLCIPQPGTAQLLDSLPYWGMYRFPYRNFGTKEVLAGNFTVDADGADGVGIRWFILERSGGGAWAVANEGTYAPQPFGAPAFVHRWMGSLAMDRFGNLALGYTRSSAQDPTATAGSGNPSTMYTARLASDPLGLLPQPEIMIRQGQGVTAGNRWGDYSLMSVDPVDDCTFWYTGDSTNANGSRQSSIASFRFAECAADLAISKTVSPDHPVAGEEIVYTITVTNNGPIGAQNVVVTDQLPARVNYLTNTDACTGVAVGATGTLTCPIGTIAAGGSKSFEIKVSIDSNLGGATSITNTASVASSANESNPADNTISLTHLVNESADVRVTKVCKPDTEPAPAGTSGVCTILVSNDGPSAARIVNLVDTHVSNGVFTLGTPTVSAGGPCVVASGVVSCPLGTILPGATVRVDVPVSSDDNVDVNDIARATSATPDPGPANNEATAGLSFDASANLSITKTGPVSATAGTQFNYTLSVDNAGPSTATNVVVSDELPVNVDFVSAVASVGTYVAVSGTVTWNLGNVAPADPIRTLIITVFVHPDVTNTLINNASVTSTTSDPDAANNLATWSAAVNAVAGLTLTKTDSPDPVIAGNRLTYTLKVGNGGPSTAQDVVVTDMLPADTTLVSAVGGTGATACAEVQLGVVSCEVGDLDPGESETIFITVLVSPSVLDGTVLINNAEATSPTDPDGAQASASTTVIAQADIWIDKTGVQITGNPSRTIRYTLAVYNKPGCESDDPLSCGMGGPSDAQNVVVTDTLPLDPKKVKFVFASQNCTYTQATHKVTCNVAGGVLPAGQSATFIIDIQVAGSVGTFTNNVTVTTTTVDPKLANNSDQLKMIVKGGTARPSK